MRHHFDASRVLAPIVTFVAETLVPLIVVAPKDHVLVPSETATGLPGGTVVEPLGGSLLQPTIIQIADRAAKISALLIKRNDCRQALRVADSGIAEGRKPESPARNC